MTGSIPEQTISQEKYVSVATFRKTGVAVATATWIVPLDGGRVGLLTSLGLRQDKAATEQPERDTAVERCPRPGQSRRVAGGNFTPRLSQIRT